MVKIVDITSDLVQFRTMRRGWPSSSNVYLLRDGSGAVLLDAGLGVEPDVGLLLGAVQETLRIWGLSLSDVHTLVLTHTHSDHAGGTIPIVRATGAQVLVPKRGWTQAADPFWQANLILPIEVVFEVRGLRDFDAVAHFRDDTMPEPFSNEIGIDWILVDDGDEIKIGPYSFVAHHTPGHDVSHLVWADLDIGLAFTGDMLQAGGTSLPWYPHNAGGIDRYISSVELVRELNLKTVCPGHGSAIHGSTAIIELIDNTLNIVKERDRRILNQLMQAPTDFSVLDDLIYNKAVRKIIPWASSVTVAHISRLEQNGIICRDAKRKYIVDPIAAKRFLQSN